LIGKSKIYPEKNKIRTNKGRIIVAGAGKDISNACRKTNQLMIELGFTTMDIEQNGPARILSLSLDSMKRNFTIGQQNENLILRLRTTETGENGTNPEVILCPLKQRKKYDIKICYRPGELDFYLDGKKVDVNQITGNFSNWDSSCQLLFGNELRESRPWEGSISQVSIYDSSDPK